MSETTEFKSIEEIAREDGWSEADSYFDDVLAFGEIVRRAFTAQEKKD